MLVEEERNGSWALVETLGSRQQAALDNTAAFRFRVTVPELPPPSVTFAVVREAPAAAPPAAGAAGGLTAGRLQELAATALCALLP